MYVTCETGSDGKCTNKYHRGDSIRTEDKTCKIGRQWAERGYDSRRECELCGTVVPDHLGMRVNDLVLDAYTVGAKAYVPPLIRPDSPSENFTKLISSGIAKENPHICDHCAQRLCSAIDYKSKNPGNIVCWGKLLPFMVSIDFLNACEFAIVTFATMYADRGVCKFSVADFIDGIQKTPCIIGVNDPVHCRCGIWQDWKQMSYQLRIKKGRPEGAPYGDRCAQIIARAGFELKSGYDQFVLSRNRKTVDRKTKRDAAASDRERDHMTAK